MIKIAIKHILDNQKQKQLKEREMRERVAESVKEATLAAWEREEGWSSGGENSDGGAPITPSPPTPSTKKGSRRNREPTMQAKGSWKVVSNPVSCEISEILIWCGSLHMFPRTHGELQLVLVIHYQVQAHGKNPHNLKMQRLKLITLKFMQTWRN